MRSFSIKKYLLMLTILFTAGMAQAESFVEFIVVGRVWPDHKWGHVSLRVKDDTRDLIFDFGRYGKMWGFFNTEGDPILRVWKNANEKHMRFQKEGNPVVHTIRFAATPQQVEGVLRRFDLLTEGIKPYSKSSTLDYYRLKNQAFHSMYNNCVTMSVQGFMNGLPQINVNSSKYAKGEDLYFWARVKAVGLAYDNAEGTWSHIWWPQDLLNLLQKEYVSKGLATEETH